MSVEKHISWWGGSEKSRHKYFRFCYCDKTDPELAMHQKYFTLIDYGTKKKALTAAQAYKKEFLENFACLREEDPFYKVARLKRTNGNGHINPILIRHMNLHVNKEYIRRRNRRNPPKFNDLWNGHKGKQCKFLTSPPKIVVSIVNQQRKEILGAKFTFTDPESYRHAYTDACSLLIDEGIFDEHHFLTMMEKKPTWSIVLKYILAYQEYQKNDC